MVGGLIHAVIVRVASMAYNLHKGQVNLAQPENVVDQIDQFRQPRIGPGLPLAAPSVDATCKS